MNNKITSLTIRYERTESLQDYRNVRIGLTATVDVRDGDPDAALLAAHQELESYVLEALDQEREREGLPARYDPGPRYSLVHWKDLDMLFVVDAETRIGSLPGRWEFGDSRVRGQRLHIIDRFINQRHEVVTDYSDLTPEEVAESVWRILDDHYAVVVYRSRDEGGGVRDACAAVPADWARGLGRYGVRIWYFPNREQAEARARGTDGWYDVNNMQYTEFDTREDLLYVILKYDESVEIPF